VGYPQIRLVGLLECGTHVAFDAAIGSLRTREHALAREVFRSIGAGMLLLADRGFFGVDLWKTAAATGADLLWRVRKDIVLAVAQQLSDGSYLSEIFDQSDIHHTRAGVPVRVIQYTIGDHDTVYRLITTILDPTSAPASELAALYAQRWEFESTLDEIKTHLGGSNLGLRSQHPDGAEQELFGFLLMHHAIRALIHQAAREGDHDPDRISFNRTLRVVRRQVTGQAAFPRGRLARAVKATLAELLDRLLPPRRRRANPRVIKRKVSGWPLKPQVDSRTGSFRERGRSGWRDRRLLVLAAALLLVSAIVGVFLNLGLGRATDVAQVVSASVALVFTLATSVARSLFRRQRTDDDRESEER
jgi:hypothetical protein